MVQQDATREREKAFEWATRSESLAKAQKFESRFFDSDPASVHREAPEHRGGGARTWDGDFPRVFDGASLTLPMP